MGCGDGVTQIGTTRLLLHSVLPLVFVCVFFSACAVFLEKDVVKPSFVVPLF